MTLFSAFAALLLATPAFASDSSISSLFGGEKVACALFRLRYPQFTFYPNSTGYTFETQSHYWSATTFSGPACVFVPQDAQQVGFAVSTMTLTLSKFAVRSGGHMPIPGFNGIDNDGILLSTSNLTTLALSSDKAVVSVGAGNRWRDVYSYLAPSGLAAVGGRVGGVGVSGFHLGGGISFYSNQYGFGADNVVKFQCVLASGTVVEATATNAYSDLFWALKGGANSFAIVTRFDIKTVKSSKVWVGIAQYDQSQEAGYLDAVYNFGKYGSLDSKAAIIPTILTFPAAQLTAYAAAKFYDSAINNPTAFENFTALPAVADSFDYQPLADYIAYTDSLQPVGLRQEFRTLSSIVNQDAVKIIHDTFIQTVNSKLAGVANLQASVTFQPVTKHFIQQGIDNGGNPQGVDISKAPFFWVVENWTWTNAADDSTVRAVADQVISDTNKLLKAKSVNANYLYINDAGKGQPIFQGYPAANLARLKTIRSKYDPMKIYTNLMPGGWKVADA